MVSPLANSAPTVAARAAAGVAVEVAVQTLEVSVQVEVVEAVPLYLRQLTL